MRETIHLLVKSVGEIHYAVLDDDSLSELCESVCYFSLRAMFYDTDGRRVLHMTKQECDKAVVAAAVYRRHNAKRCRQSPDLPLGADHISFGGVTCET